jgi:farnesyl diphosphate synthase
MTKLHRWHQQALRLIERQMAELLHRPTRCATLIESMRYSSLDGGKRIRPLFTLAAGTLSQADEETTIKCGCAIELIHCFSLIHDDLPIMDNDDLRRGKPTNHKVFGDAVALLAGDALHALCFEVLSGDTFNIAPQSKLRIIHLVAEAIGLIGMVGGQSLDWLSTGKLLSFGQLQEMHLLKTGALLRAAILSGYLAGPTYNQDQFTRLQQLANKIGLLFQIVDDIIDVTEESSTLGKTANKDAASNKATYVSVLGLDQAKNAAHQLHHEIIKLLKAEKDSTKLAYLADCVYFRHS